ncbi:MAG: carboxypeptidase regulatory-like domain-containing protein [Bryobacteraceae bacterium]
MSVRRLFVLVASLCVLTTTAQMCFGQANTGIISGLVKDPSGAPVPGASVVITNVGTNAETKAETGPDGYYRVPNLVPGQYTVSVEARNFRRMTMSPQRLSVGDTLRIDVLLEIGAVTETVTVEAVATQVNTEDAQLGKVIRDPADLPILSGAGGRNPLNLAATQPGVVFAGQVGDFSVNGQRAQSNNYMFEGADSNDLAINTSDSVNVLNPNVVSEFRLVTGAQKAEYGRNAGSTVLVEVKSGGNEFHGGASEIFRNTRLNAVPFFQKNTPGPVKTFTNGLPRKPQWNTNDFDAYLSGPVVRDRSFFTVSYLGFRRRQGVTNSATVPNDAQRAIINANGTDAAKKLLALVPAASTGNTLYSSPSNARNRDQGLAKFDHQFTSANRMAFTFFHDNRWSDMAPFAFSGSTIPGFGSNGTWKYTNLILRDTHIFSPTLFNEVRASFHRTASDGVKPINRTKLSSLGLGKIVPDNPDAEGPPWVVLSGFSSFGNTIQGPQARFDNTWQLIDNASWTRGRHYLKFGGDVRSYAQNQRFTFINNGYIQITGAGTSLGLVPQIPGLSSVLNDFANGFATLFVQNSNGIQGYRTRAANLFMQDDWKFRSNFTLNFGLRWEYNTGMKELNNQVATLRLGQKSTVFPDAPTNMVYYGDSGITRSTYKEDLNNFGPRFGFAYDVLGNGKISVRGGYGLMYDIPITELTLQFLGIAPYGIQPLTYYTMYADPWASSQVNPIPQPFPFKPPARGGKFNYVDIAPIGFTVMDPHFATPYSQHWNLNVQYQLSRDWLVDVGYVANNGVKLLNRRNINPATPGPGAEVGNTDDRRVLNVNHPEKDKFGGYPFAAITNQLTDANSNYNSLQISATKRFSRGLAMTHAYTWGHAIDSGSGVRTTGGTSGQGRIDNARLDRGNSEQDIRHRYVMTFQYELPWLKSSRSPMGFILGGWGVEGIAAFSTGVPIDIYEPNDRALNDSDGQRPDYIGGTPQFYDPRRVDAVTGRPNSWFDGTGGGSATLATNPFFRRVGSGEAWSLGAGRFGNFGRNVFHGPGLNNWELGVFKKFRITERHTVQFRAEFFNAFNHTQFNLPNTNVGSANFGRITGSRDPRLIQLALKYMF